MNKKNKISLIISSLLIFPTLALAELPQDYYRSARDLTPTLVNFDTVPDGGFHVAISNDGSISSFASPVAYEHIGIGFIGEGYLVCATLNTVQNGYFEHGSTESGFGVATTTAAPLTGPPYTSATSTRTTTDSFLKIKNSYSFSGPNRSLYITMQLTNLLNVPLQNVTLARIADFDVDTGGVSGWAGFSNYFGITNDSAFAWNDPVDAAAVGRTAHKMSLRHISAPAAIGHVAQVRDSFADESCTPTLANIPPTANTRGDHSVGMQYNIGTLGAKKSVTVKLAYTRD